MNKLLSLALLCFCALTCSSQTLRFGVHSSPFRENITAHGDLNGDGNEDLILANSLAKAAVSTLSSPTEMVATEPQSSMKGFSST
jgi:hypothetical protein